MFFVRELSWVYKKYFHGTLVISVGQRRKLISPQQGIEPQKNPISQINVLPKG